MELLLLDELPELLGDVVHRKWYQALGSYQAPSLSPIEPICHVRQGRAFGSKLGPIGNISNLALVHHSD